MTQENKVELPILIYQDKKMYKKEFLEKCAGFAQELSKKNDENNIVALVMNKSVELIISMYSCFLYGYTFVPVDPAYPDNRINQILQDTKPAVILTDKENVSRIEQENCYDAVTFMKDAEIEYHENPKIAIKGLQDVEVNDEMRSTIYFTSGSTGKPKGVIVKKRGQLAHLEGLAEHIDFSVLRQSICLTSISFDLFFDQSIMPLYFGLSLIVADEREQKDPRKLMDIMKNSQIDVLSVTPSRVNQIMGHDESLSCFQNIKYLMIGGEACSNNLLKELQKLKNTKILNLYGPTEASVYATLSDLSEKPTVDIGKPLKNYKIYILDDNYREVPQNTKGEIAIGGLGVAEGYLHLGELTQNRFIYLPEYPEERVYLTGDVGKIDEDGVISCYGRIDHQVKYKGYRIELEEIESVTNSIPGVKECIADVKEFEQDIKIIALWYTGEILEKKMMLDYLEKNLPLYMLPARIYHLDRFEYTSNGKLNRNVQYSTERELKSAHNGQQEELSTIAKKVVEGVAKYMMISPDEIDMDASLASIGINSLVYVRVLVEVEEAFNLELSLELLNMNEQETFKCMIEKIEKDIMEKSR